jgi:FdhD protein
MKGIQQINLRKFSENQDFLTQKDWVAIEEPLEIILAFGSVQQRKRQSISITMRTPTGHDDELALGFLFTEGIIQNPKDILTIKYLANEQELTNSILIELSAQVNFQTEKLQRHFYTSSSCGVCGKTSLDLVEQQSCYVINPTQPKINMELLWQLPQKLRTTQNIFEQTGSIHAAALFDCEGNIVALREDVGRHNALDKLIGFALKTQQLPLQNSILLLSGRISFELVQKAMMAGIPIIAAIGAPSSLAIALAEANNITLVGFLKEGRGNVYSFPDRIKQ